MRSRLRCPTSIRGSSVVERPTVNRVAVGSNPTPGARDHLRLIHPATRLAVCEQPGVFRVPSPRRSWNPKAIGELSEAAAVYHLVRAGYDVARPLGDNARYDLILEDGDRLLRVQVKTGRLNARGSVFFPTCSSQAHRGRGYSSYRGQCELFAVYCPELDETYLVPVAGTGSRGCSLRVRPSKNYQTRGVRWAADYRVGVVDVRALLTTTAESSASSAKARSTRRPSDDTRKRASAAPPAESGAARGTASA